MQPPQDIKSSKKKSQNLGLVSNTEPRAYERRRLPRLTFSSELVRLLHTGKVYPVIDLSEGGMGLRVVDRQDMAVLPVGMALEGTLKFRAEKIEFKARVRHIHGDMIGVEYTELDSKDQEKLRRYLDPASLGKDLKPVPSQDGGPLWYHGPSGTDLLLWRGTDGQYHRFLFSALGSFVKWEDALSTGLVAMPGEIREEIGTFRFETMHLTPDAMPDPGKLSIAKTVLSSSNLPEDVKRWCQRKLEI